MIGVLLGRQVTLAFTTEFKIRKGSLLAKKSEVEVRLDWIVATSVTQVISGRKTPQNVKSKLHITIIKLKTLHENQCWTT